MVDSTIAEFEANQELLSNPQWLYDIDGLSRGRIDIRICRNGDWLHDGGKISRVGLIRLLESSLLNLDGCFYLRAPEQLLRIEVDDCPFLIVDFEVRNESISDAQSLIIKTTTGITRLVSLVNPLSVLPFAETTFVKKNSIENTSIGNRSVGQKKKSQLKPASYTLDEASSTHETSPPVVLIRDGMFARFNRNSYYRLIDVALEIQESSVTAGDKQLVIRSSGENFVIA